jgi:4'-phosphopantetheinyl transferase
MMRVFLYNLSDFRKDYEAFKATLSFEELARYHAIIYPEDKIQFVLRKGILRSLLASILCTQPHLIQLSYTAYGKPYIFPTTLYFNTSHSNGRMVVVISSCSVGVDLELMNPDIDVDAVSKIIMSYEELDLWQKLDPKLKLQYFYKLWSFKEAYLKQRGIGLLASQLPSFSWLLKETLCVQQIAKYGFLDLSCKNYSLIISCIR